VSSEFRFEEVVETRDRLRELVREPSRLVANKVIDHIDDYCRRFIALSPFVVLASRSADGVIDLSPKGDSPGFVRVLGHRVLAVPDRLGNNRVDTLCNLTETESVGMIFFVPGKGETLRISGRGTIVRDPQLNARLAHKVKPPTLAVVVNVRRAFFHCSKCMIRSGLWEPEKWPDSSGLPRLAETMVRHGALPDSVQEIDAIVQRDAVERLY
jgi:PPOX class probable FMN-dependent enzyme